MNTSSGYPFFINSSLELETDKTPSMYGRYAIVMFIIGILIMLLNIIGIKLVNNSKTIVKNLQVYISCLLYTSDAADDMQCVDLGGRRIIKKTMATENVRDGT